ncbi:MAG: dephospho-CoA kinase [Rickettsia endosymbiont of Pseudomimeciton antennatum]|nr:dephospho-CoA kinase [Rickettsia endosymbiont of Pseudomimeciton antennatum]MCC8397987.1 dephospho-CoA kinase [Rickettsia endosymbiont of Labidopullus appendiculatus]
MICVGITGSYASGKTFVLNYLADLGFMTFSADEYIKELYKELAIQNIILNLLPDLKVFDKRKIAELIYANDLSRSKLQNFIHPFVVEGLSLFKRQNNDSEITFAEIPLLFEAGFDKYFDFYVTTFCSEESRLKRAMSREGFSLTTYNKIAQIQLSQQIKIAKADFVINTDVNIVDLDKQITQLIQKLKCSN